MFRLTGLSSIDFNALFNLSPNPYVIVDRDWRLVGMNDAYLSVTGRRREDITGLSMFEAFPSDADSIPGRMLRQSFTKVFESGEVDHLPILPYPIADASGVVRERYWSATHTPMLGEDGSVALILQHTVDVTELQLLRKSAADEGWGLQSGLLRRAGAVQDQNLVLGAEREYLHALFEQAPGFMAVFHGPDHVFRIINGAYRDLVARDDLIGRTIREGLPELAGQGFFELLDRVYATGIPYGAQAARVLLQRRAGEPHEEVFLDFIYQPIRDATGAVNGIFVQGHDVTRMRRAQEEARSNEDRFRTLAQSLPNQVWTATPDGRVLWVNDEMYRYSGRREIYFDNKTGSGLVHDEDNQRAKVGWETARQAGETFETEMRLRRHDGVYRWFLSRAVPVRSAEGDIVMWVATNTDIDGQKRTETNLETLATTLGHRVEERTVELERTQAALRQSQKMEAIGNLAGGIAHDFNNLLQVITGNLQLLSRDFSANETAQKRLTAALSGAQRGARLASQLLAFGRRQPLAPKVVDLGRLVRDMDNLLRRSLGEAVEIDTIVSGGLWHTLVDPTNVENALLNLAINARDAMEGHGSLTIEIGNAILDDAYARDAFDIEPGQYVLLAVTDTGCGMAPDILEKVFDPFFSTKPEGKGTGLGLSMVYGFVKQSGGHIRIYSEPGSGTTVRIYLPRSLDEEDALFGDDDLLPAKGGSETVLVVEDDEAVRDITVSLLSELGYRVLKAKDADSGLAIVESGVPIDLLFTDVVMPGQLKSRELAVRAKDRLPGLAVLFTSGYTENSIVHGGRLDPGVHLLSKPYTREVLARKVRQVLELARPAIAMDTAASGAAPVKTGDIGQMTVARTEPEQKGGTHEERPLTVLLVEDEALIRISTADSLEDAGMTVIEAGAAGEAMRHVEAVRFDILVTDVHLPDMSGLDLIRAFRETHPDLPVIFATGDRNVEGAEGLTHSALITKPYDYDSLVALIRSMVTR